MDFSIKLRGEYYLVDPHYLIRIHLKGDLPPSIIGNLFQNYPDRKLSGDFYASIGFDKLGKEINLDRKNIQLNLVYCEDNNHKDSFSDATVVFFNFNDRNSFNRINNTFNLSLEVGYRHKRTIIGLLTESLEVNQEERDELRNNINIEYHEIIPNDFRAIENVLIGIIEKSLPLAQFLMKIACLGTKKKTSIIHDFAQKKFTVNYLPTLGVDITNRRLNIHGLRVDLIIVDTAEQEFFGKLRPSYYRGASAGMIFFEFDNRDSFKAIKNWHNEISSNVEDSIPIALVGIEGKEPKIPVNEAKALAQEFKMDFYEIAEKRHRLDEITEKMTKIILTN